MEPPSVKGDSFFRLDFISQAQPLQFYVEKPLGAGYGNKITQGKRERASFECPYQNALGS